MKITTHSPRTQSFRQPGQQTTLAESPQRSSDTVLLGFTKDDLHAGGAGLVGGIAGGAGVYLGARAGFEFGLGMVDAVSSDVAAVKLTGILVGLPVAMLYMMVGGAAGGAVGGGLGMAAGMGIHSLASKKS